MPETAIDTPARHLPRLAPEPAWRLIAWALAWQVAAACASVAGGILSGLVVAFLLSGGRFVPLNEPALLVGSTVCLQAVLLWAAWRRSRIAGEGSRAAGLGWVAVRRRWLVAALAVVLVVNLAGLLLLLRYAGVEIPHTGTMDLMQKLSEMGRPAQVAMVLLLAAGAPIAEELFFRGWLWTALRRRWAVLPVMGCTSLLWLMAHLLDGVTRPLFLIPAAIVLSLARHYCGSVRASIVLHCFNNLLAVGLLALALLH